MCRNPDGISDTMRSPVGICPSGPDLLGMANAVVDHVARKRSTPAMTFRSILCPVDFSRHAGAALQHAAATAHRFGGGLTVMFVNDPLLLSAASRLSGGRRQFVERTRVELARFVKRTIATRPRTENQIALVVVTGKPADEILRTAKRLRSDLIVIGTQGLGGFQRMF